MLRSDAGAAPSPFRGLLGSRLFDWAFGLALFLLALVPRAVEPISRTDLWYKRSLRFWDALLTANWLGTFQKHHPGVTVMWLSGAGMKYYGWLFGHDSGALEAYQPDATWVGVLPLAVVIALGIVYASFVIARLFGRGVGVAAGLLMALDPFYLAHAKVLHVDGLLSTLLLISVLTLVRYGEEGPARRLLVMSGIFIGLSILTKSPALLLCPYAAVVMTAAHFRQRRRWDRRLVEQVGKEGLLLLGVILLICLALFPALWTSSGRVLAAVFKYVTHHVAHPHKHNVYFFGTAGIQDPGMVFYLATIVWRTTFVTLPLALATTVWAVIHARRGDARASKLLWVLLFAALYFLQMGVSGKKGQRYLLPVFVFLDLAAALGLVGLAQMAAALVRPRFRALTGAGVVALPLLGQAALLLSYHPHYGLHANHLLGGPGLAEKWLAVQLQGEGLERAGRFLNNQPGARHASVVLWGPAPAILERKFRGKVLKRSARDRAHYRVYYREPVLRRFNQKYWEPYWKNDQYRKPLWTFRKDGIEYVWIYTRDGFVSTDKRLRQPKLPTLNRRRRLSGRLSPGQGINY